MTLQINTVVHPSLISIGIYDEIYYFQTSNAMPCLSEVSSSSCLRDHYHCCLRQKLRLVFL